MNAFIIDLENRPGALADMAEAIAEKGINITAVAGASGQISGSIAVVTNDEDATRSALQGAGARFREVALTSASLEHRPGSLAEATRSLANAGVNIEALMPMGMEGNRITVGFAVDNVDAARSALGESASVSA
ncbi:MAG TPA: ACT domain-containing protein [Candidatus Limnocylindria bacterium]|nr:ACT domain-containing protein [Candidatus Limnocylindria bacterium]